MNGRRLVVVVLFAFLAAQVAAQDLSSAYASLRLGNFDTAFALFNQAAEGGSSEAQYQLGKLYLAGRGHARDDDRGLYWLEEAAHKGETGAQYTLGLMLLDTTDAERGRHWLQLAAEGGNARAQRQLELDSQAEPQAAHEGSAQELRDAWLAAAVNCRETELEQLLAKGADVHTRDNYGCNALHYLVACDSTEEVSLLLDRGIDPDLRDNFGDSPLGLAVAGDSRILVERLLDAGADPSQESSAGGNLFHLAVHRDALSALEALLPHRAAINAADRKGYTALDQASLLRNERAQRLLRDAGAAHSAQWSGEGRERATAHYLRAGDNPQERWSSARQAALQDQADLLAVLVKEMGPTLLSEVDSGQRSLLMYAARSSSMAALDLLLASGAAPDQVNEQGLSALMLAAKHGHTRAALRLLAAGADPWLQDVTGGDAVLLALQASHDDTARAMLEKASSDRDTPRRQYLHEAIRSGAVASTQWLLMTADVADTLDARSRSALWYAAQRCDQHSAKSLLGMGANANRADEEGYTPLHIAASSGCVGLFGELLRAGATVDSRTYLGNTALLLSARRDSTAGAQALMEQGADVSGFNSAGESALMVAVRGGNEVLVAALLERGADPYRRNELGESAAGLARRHSPAMHELVESHGAFKLPLFD